MVYVGTLMAVRGVTALLKQPKQPQPKALVSEIMADAGSRRYRGDCGRRLIGTS